MSDTPKTDALKPEGSFHHWTTDQLFFHSRALERELNATTAELERTKEQLRVARKAIKALLDAEDPRIGHDEFVERYGFSQPFCNENALNALAQSNPDKEEPNVPLE